jgi:molybdopterin converting factor subunit 1
MKANVKLFAILKEKAGVADLTLEIPDTSTVTDLINELNHRYPKLADTKFLFRVAVNAEYVHESHRLKAGDEIALIPPVSGGAISGGGI